MDHRRIGLRALVLGAAILELSSATPARAEDWSLPDSRIGTRTAPLLLLSRADVQAELRLGGEQVAGLRTIIADLTRRGLALRGKTGPAVVVERRAIDQAQLDWLGENLSRNQLDRLEQLEIQWEGPGAMLSRPRVAEYLRLTDEQRQSLAKVIAERNTALARDPASAGKESASFHGRIMASLSASQQELWYRLLGTPLAFHQQPRAATRDDATQRAGHTTEPR
ncbi:hypothetical protein OJF2_21850 [Aquisphaera giovannonii]|uniref:LTXXQ motif protein n=1 Tax=Aquisphaera giovannonii TaxID=406548 RepID=A0A5B9W0A7_9BACT|nr:hypothetical protein [Aquisphaera giovannonii]QEH33679.1 hypothetical protein OJF2_21850 [Aquisphaera giovannonii]